MNAPPRTRVAVRVGERQVDVAIPQGATLYDALRELGVDLGDPRVVVVDSTGRALDRYAATGADLVDGAVLHVVSKAGPARGRGRRGRAQPTAPVAPADPLAARPAASAWWLGPAVAGAAVILAVVALGGADVLDAGGSPRALVLAAALAVAALGLALLRGRPGVAGSGWPTAAAGLAGAGAAVLTVDPSVAGAGMLMVLCGLVGALVPVALRWAVGRRHRDPVADLAGAVAVVLVVATAVVAATFLLELPAVLAAAALLGAVPLGLRAVPVLSVSVPDEQLLDVSVVQRTATSVRAPEAPPLAEVNERAVVRAVGSAERRQDAGTVTVAAAAPVLAGLLLAGAEPGPLTRWTSLAACVLVALALALGPRTARGAVVRWAPRVAAGLVAIVLAVWGIGLLRERLVLAVVATVVAGLGAAALSVPIGRGWRSVGFSRLGDTLEGLATVLALPLALVGGGAIEALRTLVS